MFRRAQIIAAIFTVGLGGPAAVSQGTDDIASKEKQARALIKQKKWDKVIELLNPNTDVASPSGYLLLATSYNETRDYTNLVRVIRLLAEKRPKDFHIQFMLGDALMKEAKVQKEVRARQESERAGIDSFRAAIKLRRSFRPAYQALVNYFQQSNLNHEAREQLVDMLRVFGHQGDIHADLCRLYSLDGFLSQAIRHCQRAMTLAPDYPESPVYLAQAYYDQKEVSRAEETLVRAARQFPQSELVQYGTGQFFLKKANYPVASKYLKQAVASKESSGRSQISLAQSLFESGQETEALPHFIRACQINGVTQSELLAAASRLRLKGNSNLAQKYSQSAGGCKRQ